MSWGELTGVGRWELEPIPGGTRVRYHWHVDADRPWMRLLGPLLGAFFSRNHDALMTEGGNGLAAYLDVPLLGMRHWHGEAARALYRHAPVPPRARRTSVADLGAAVLAASRAPFPTTRWATLQRWRDLLFLHWRVEPALIRRRLDELVPEVIDGSAWVTLVCMRTPRLSTAHGIPLSFGDYAQMNLRTYVRHGDRPAVSFLHVACGSRLVAEMVRRLAHMPYAAADVSLVREGARHGYRCRGLGELDVTFRPRGRSSALAAEAELDRQLVERYASLSMTDGRTIVGDLAHPPWDLCDVDMTIEKNSLLSRMGITGIDPLHPDRVAFSPGTTAVTWAPR